MSKMWYLNIDLTLPEILTEASQRFRGRIVPTFIYVQIFSRTVYTYQLALILSQDRHYTQNPGRKVYNQEAFNNLVVYFELLNDSILIHIFTLRHSTGELIVANRQ